jgi:hypothetical protein
MVASLSLGALAGMSLGTELSALRKRAILQQIEQRWFMGLFALQKGIAIGDIFVQC